MPDGGIPDAMEGEADIALDTVAKMSMDAAMNGTFVSTAGGPSGSIEPVAWLSGRLLAEYDEINGPYDGTWASHPTNAADFTGRNVMTMPLADVPQGARADFIAWFSGEMRLASGAQKIGVAVSTGAAGFFDVLNPDGTVLVHCSSTQPDCNFTTTAAGWYAIHAAWRRPPTVQNSYRLRWTASGGLQDVTAAQLRTPMHTARLEGSRLEGFTVPRSLRPVENAIMLDTDKPVDLTWGGSLFGLGASSSYRSETQLRIAEGGMYNLTLDANGGSSYRLWIDGEWANQAAAFNYVEDDDDPAPETITRMLAPGWHDLVIEGYDTRGNSGDVTFALGKMGQTLAAPSLSATRPGIGAAPRTVHTENTVAQQLVSNGSIMRTLTVPPLAGASPAAIAVDLSVTMRPVIWNGVTIKVYPPGVATGIPLTFDDSQRINNNVGEIDGSLTRTLLGAAAVNAQGDWRVEIFHPMAGGVGGANTVSDVQLHVHFAGAPGVDTPPLVPATSTYSRMFTLEKESELRAILAETIKPAGTSIELSAQVCADDKGASCQAALSAEALASSKPSARFVKVIVTFTSDGFAVPIVNKLVLRHVK